MRALTPRRLPSNARDEALWRYIQLFAALFSLLVLVINCIQYSKVVYRSQFLNGAFGSNAPQAFRPRLFQSPPTLTALKASAKVIDPELFRGIPENFENGFKNPCWKDASGAVSCIPYFYVLSGFQSGIQDLQAKIQKHPDIARSGNPQPHFWAEKRPNERLLKPMNVAVPRIKEAPERRIVGCKNQRETEEQRAERIRCVTEKCYTPSQAEDHAEADKAGLTYEQMQTPLLMRAFYGSFKPKFVVVLRDPVARVHSAFWFYGHYWQRYGGRSAQGFLNYVKEQISGYRNCTDMEKHDVFHCSLYLESLSQYLEDIFFHCDQLMRGMYSVWLNIWFSFFPRESFLIVKAEDYFREPKTVLASIFAHLGLRAPTDAEWDTILSQSHINAAATGHEMLPEARQLVSDFYRPFNRDLANLLGDKKWLWNDT